MYWTEQGMRPTVQTALMNGQVMRMFVNTPLHWPNALMFDTDDNSVYLADGGIKKIQQLSALGMTFKKIKNLFFLMLYNFRG